MFLLTWEKYPNTISNYWSDEENETAFNDNDPMLFQAEFGPFEYRNGNRLGMVFEILCKGFVIFFLMLQSQPINEPLIGETRKVLG